MVYRWAVMEDLDKIMAVMHQTVKAMPDKSLYIADGREVVQRHIYEEGKIILAVVPEDDQIAGFLMLRYPKEAEDNLGRDLGLSKEDLSKVVHMESVAVATAFRGKGIMREMISNGESAAARQGYIYSMCTVSPKNPWSLSNMQKSGYRIAATTPKYGGVIRHILVKRIGERDIKPSSLGGIEY